MNKHTVAVLGASGYSGAELLRYIAGHGGLELVWATADSNAGRALSEVFPHLADAGDVVLQPTDPAAVPAVDLAFLALPHGSAADTGRELVRRGVKVVDLSADWRLRDPAAYPQWYGRAHPHPDELGTWAYGLTELNRDAIRGSDRVANPGCYPTAAVLALAPLARAGVIEDVVIDAKSGVSGAGRAATEATHFVTVDENVNAYGVPRHRHTPEIEQELAALGSNVKITFTPHLLPLDQGELVSCYVALNSKGGPGPELTLYHEAYADEPFVELARAPVGVRAVRETNICRISVHRDERTGRVIVFGAIDNLWKGAASQAVQNLNLMFGRPETEGIS
jgi:N-acetyl-gamma-glutamyl-phosphate reductase